ncbi:MAG TPA: ribonuclease H-like domain-containing protein [Vicinamibacterales bacterium]|nr:ribonuclease H-like domain-containing protein [Vicinamibacterales bacterium]
MSALGDRIRGIVKPVPVPEMASLPPPADLSVLGGEHRDGCFVVERRWTAESRHGREAIGTFAECLDDGGSAAPLFAADARAPFVFFDLETTGLSGGAGTLAFLVGCGSFAADGGFAARQYLLSAQGEERALLERVHAELAGAGAIVSFNGKSFDAPLLESRFAFHRLARTLAGRPHVDALHPARQFWACADCSLGALERRLLGVRRAGDIDGFDVPARYFQFVRSGNARPLEQVLEHNRSDLLTLAALTARLFFLARAGAGAARDAREAIALGRVYGRSDDLRRSRDAFSRAVELAGGVDDLSASVDALRGLAITLRRMREYHDAAACWSRLMEMDDCPHAVAREAAEALAIHHEHRVRDLDAARSFALKGLIPGEGAPGLGNAQRTPRWAENVRYRVARIERKLSGRLL